MSKNNDWTALNRAITDGSLYTANLRRLRRYLKAANDKRLSAGPYLAETIQRLISQRESARQARWTVIGVVVGTVALIASVLGLVVMLR